MAEGQGQELVEFEENYEDDLIDSGLVGILGMLNFKIVPKEPGDPGFSRLNAVIPPESRLYAAEYVRLQDKYDKLKEEMTAMASSSELQVREELTETKEALAKERREVEEVKVDLERVQKEAEESKEALLEAQMEVSKAKEALVTVKKEAEEAKDALTREKNEVEEAKKAVLEEQGKVENLREVVANMQEQLNEGEKKNQEQKEEQEKLVLLLSNTKKELEDTKLHIAKKDKDIEESTQVNEDLRKRNEEMEEISRQDKENLDKSQVEKEKLDEDLRKSTSTISGLEEKLSTADVTNSELQSKLDALQAKLTEIEDNLTEEIAKSKEFKTALEEATTNLNKQESQLIEAAEIISELSKAGDNFTILEAQFETVVQINLRLDEQVADLQRRLREKASEVENGQRDLNTEREEKRRMEIKLTRYRESLQSVNLELTQFIEELKNTIGFADTSEEVDPDPSTLQSRLESLSAHVQSKLKSREDNLKELKAELARTRETILAINEHLQRQSFERMSMPPPLAPPPISRRAIMPPPQVTALSLVNTQSSCGDNIRLTYRDVIRPQPQVQKSLEVSSETNLFPDFEFPSLEASHGIMAADFDDSDFCAMVSDEDDDIEGIGNEGEYDDIEEEEVTLVGCRECGRTFPTWAELYQHQKTVHTVQMSKKVVQGRASNVKSLFGTFSTKQKTKKCIPNTKIKHRKKDATAIPKIKIKQRKTRSGAHWNIVTPSPAPSTIRNGEDDENQNENTLMDERILTPEPLNSQNDDQSISSPQYRPPLSEVSNSTAVNGTTAVVQSQQHGIDKTKSRSGCFCLCGKKSKNKRALVSHIQYQRLEPKYPCQICGYRFKKPNILKRHLEKMHTKSTMKSCKLCGQKFWTMEQLRRHQVAVHASNVEGHQGDSLFQDLINTSAAPATTGRAASSTSRRHPRSAAKAHGVDISKQDQGAFCKCGKNFFSKKELNVHISYKTSDWKFECGMCPQRFYYLTYLRRHYTDIHKDPSILDEFKAGCRLCGEMFREWDDYRLHVNKKHSKNNKNGKLMKAKPRLRNSFEHHQPYSSQHSGDKKFKCNVCPQKFKFLSSLQSHQKNLHNAKNVRPLSGCHHCGKTFLTKRLLLNHISHDHPRSKRPLKRKTRSKKKRISKLASDLTVPTQSSSQDHHVVDISRVKIEQADSELGALRDSVTTSVKHGIDYSKKARLGFYCKCGVKTTGPYAKYNLRKHIKYFTGEIHFGCPQCQLSFKSTSRLRRHMRAVHNAEYTLIGCISCGMLFENSGAMRDHRKSQHRRKQKKVEKIDLTNGPLTPAPQILEDDLEEFQQQDEEVNTPVAHTATQQEISPNVSSVSRTFATISQSLPLKKSPLKRAPLSVVPSNKVPPSLVPSQKARSWPTLPKKKHAKDMSKRHLGYYCVCGTMTRSAATLSSHIAYFTSDRKFECELCGHRSVYLAGLKNHLKTTHKLTNSYQLDLMGMGCSLCGKRGFTTQKELTVHKMAAHSIVIDSNGQDASSTGNQTYRVEPQPSTSKGLPVPTNYHAKNPSIIISTSSLSITPVVPTSASSLLETSRAPVSSLKLSPTDTRHATNIVKLNAGLFVCICGYKTNNRQNLSSHISYMTCDKRYACPICEKKFPYMSTLKKHLKRSHKRRNPHLSGCATCSAVFSSKKELLTHSLAMHSPQSNNTALQVPQQPMLTTSPTVISSAAIIEQLESASSATVWVPVTPSISVSLRTTNGPGSITLPNNPSPSNVVEPSTLSTAKGTSDEDMIIDAHLTYEPCVPQVQHDINYEMLSNGHYYCLCGQDFANTSSLNKHVKYYSSDGKFICKTCGHAFQLAVYLRNHMLKVHKIVYNISNGCKHCGKNFATNMQLYEHFRVEHNNGHVWGSREQKYTPPTTSQSQVLSQELPYSQEQIIEIQDQNAQQKSREEDHAIEEQDPLCEKSSRCFSCKCGRQCKSLVSLKHHISNQKRQYIFKCYKCPSTFNRHCNLKSHVVTVHKIPYEKGKYSCGICAETFETYERMKTHKKDVHDIV